MSSEIMLRVIKLSVIILSVIMMSSIMPRFVSSIVTLSLSYFTECVFYCYAEYYYTWCNYAESHDVLYSYAECVFSCYT